MEKCPKCGGVLEKGFALKAAGLSFVRPDKFNRYIFMDEDLQRAGFSRLLPSRARYSPSFLCRDCRVYIVDYGIILSRKQAEEAVRGWRE